MTKLRPIKFMLVGIFSLNAMFSFTSCKSKKNAESNTLIKKTAIPFRVIASGILYGGGEEGFEEGVYLGKNLEEATILLKRMNSINDTEDLKLTTQIDFENDFFVLVCDAIRSSGGYDFNIKQIEDEGNSISVYTLSKAPEGPATSVLTQPYIIFSMKKTDLTIVKRNVDNL